MIRSFKGKFAEQILQGRMVPKGFPPNLAKAARRKLIIEALILFGLAWLLSVIVSLLRPLPPQSYAGFGPFRFLVSTLTNGFEIFVFGYLLSRFFKQFKTGCAFFIILFFAYLIWAGRH